MANEGLITFNTQQGPIIPKGGGGADNVKGGGGAGGGCRRRVCPRPTQSAEAFAIVQSATAINRPDFVPLEENIDV